MKKKVFFLLGIIILIFLAGCGVKEVSADVLTSSTDTTFQKGIEKEITFAVPANTAAINGAVSLSNANLISVTETFTNKDVVLNGNKFILYGLNAEEMLGENLKVRVLIDNNSDAVVSLINLAGATPDALPISIDDFQVLLSSELDLNGDGVLDVGDITYLINVVFNNNALITDLQAIINAVIEEM